MSSQVAIVIVAVDHKRNTVERVFALVVNSIGCESEQCTHLIFFDRVVYKEGQHALPYIGGNETNPLCKCGFSFYIKLHMQPRTAIGGRFEHDNCDYHHTNSNYNRVNCSHSDNYRNKSG
jgi:hypothetical protein